jgi:hypothetical protein
LGVSYNIPIKESIDFFGTGSFGMGINFITEFDGLIAGGSTTYIGKIQMNSPMSYVGELEAGVVFWERLKIGLSFINFSETVFEMEISENYQSGFTEVDISESRELEFSRTMLLLKLGVLL